MNGRPTPEQAALLKRMRKMRAQYEKVLARAETMWDQRGAVYEEARALDPPLTYAQIAEAFGITQAAVMQKIAKVNRQREAS